MSKVSFSLSTSRFALICGLIALGSPAQALQQTSSDANQSDDEVLTFEEIIVTAAKRGAQSIQDTPYNISAVGDEDIEKRQIEDLTDLSRYVAGLEVRDAGAGRKFWQSAA